MFIGVNTHVGDAVNEQPSHVKNSLTVIGFASFGVIHGRLSLIPKVKRDKKVTYDGKKLTYHFDHDH